MNDTIKWLFKWYFWLLFGMLCFVFTFVVFYNWKYTPLLMKAIGLLTVFIGIFCFKQAKKSFFNKTSTKTSEDRQLSYIGETVMDCFFVECVLSSCNDFTKRKNVDKAKLIADKYGLSYSGNFKNGKFDGYGEFYNLYDTYFVGNELKERETTLVSSDWKNGNIEGEYKRINKDGTIYDTGTVKNGVQYSQVREEYDWKVPYTKPQ